MGNEYHEERREEVEMTIADSAIKVSAYSRRARERQMHLFKMLVAQVIEKEDGVE